MSSKFAPSEKKSTYPPWCKPGPDAPPILLVDGWPIALTAYAHWADLEIDKPVDLSEAFQIDAVTPGLEYYGGSADSGTRLELGAKRDADTNLWTIDLFVWDEWRDGEDFHWLKIPAQQDDPLKIVAPIDSVIPGIDYRTCSLYG